MSLLVILVHGLLDDVYYGYGGAGVLLLFVPLGLLARSNQLGEAALPAANRRAKLAALYASAVALVAISLTPTVRSPLHSNLGVLLQTRAELSIYRWPEWPLQDSVRRSDPTVLSSASRHYRTALEIDPGNVVAARRLGQMALSLGRYEEARKYLRLAYEAAPHQSATRQLYGEAEAVNGNVTGAADVWRGMAFNADQLEIRHWWYSHLNDAQRAQWMREAIALAGK
jgi:tetratricopeptide (TPR) repeat protein